MRDYTPAARSYELMTIFTPEVGDDQVLDQLETVTGYVRTAGGSVYQVLHEAPWGRRRFAYPIRHAGRDVREGFYSVVHFDLAPGQVTELERDLKLDERVMRHLVTHLDLTAEKTDTEGEEGAETASPAERTEVAAGDLLRNAAAAREAEEARRQAAAAQQSAQQAAQQAAAQQQAAPAPAVEATPTTATAPAASAPADEAAAANAASAEIAEAVDTTASETAPDDGTEISEAASTAPVEGATGDEVPASADPVSGEGTPTATDSTPSENTTDR